MYSSQVLSLPRTLHARARTTLSLALGPSPILPSSPQLAILISSISPTISHRFSCYSSFVHSLTSSPPLAFPFSSITPVPSLSQSLACLPFLHSLSPSPQSLPWHTSSPPLFLTRKDLPEQTCCHPWQVVRGQASLFWSKTSSSL